MMDGRSIAQTLRNTLKRVMEAAAAEGCYIQTSVEVEFFLIMPNMKSISDAADTASPALLRPTGHYAAL